MAPRSTPMPTPAFRPRSSSGTNLVSRKPEYDKRKSRDDLYLMTMTSQKQSFKPFHVPIRSTSPTHDSGSLSNRNPPAGPGVSSNSTSSHPVHPGGQDPVAIGMALGSPAHPHAGHSLSPMNVRRPSQPGYKQSPLGHSKSPLSHLQSPLGSTRSSPTPRLENGQTPALTSSSLSAWTPGSTPASAQAPIIEVQEHMDDPSKAKGKKWGIFRSKSKRGNNYPHPLNHAATAPVGTGPFDAMKPGASFPGGGVGRSDSSANRTTPRHQPIVIRSHTEPHGAGRGIERQTPLPNRGPPQGRAPDAQAMRQHYMQRLGMAPPNHSASSGGRLLDVDIPDITMERYSVMFGDLLKPQVPPKVAQSPTPQGLGITHLRTQEMNTREPQPQDGKAQELRPQESKPQELKPQDRQELDRWPELASGPQEPRARQNSRSEQPPSQARARPIPTDRHEPPAASERPREQRPNNQANPRRPPQTQISHDLSASSLLTRRQASLRKLKTMEEKSMQNGQLPELQRPRRATSPQIKASPTFNLFPAPSRPMTPQSISPILLTNGLPFGSQAAKAHERNEHRGPGRTHMGPKVSPAKNPQPVKAPPGPVVHELSGSPIKTRDANSFSPARIGTEAKLSPGKVADEKRTSPVKTRSDRTPVPAPSQRKHPLASRFQGFTPEMESKPTFGTSPRNSGGSPAPDVNKPLPQPIKDVARGVITPPASTASSNSSTPKKETTSPVMERPHAAEAKRPDEDDVHDERALREAVKASITRQISLSREQRDMLKPYHSQGYKNSSAPKAKPLTIQEIATGKHERVAETKKATPVIITPGPEPEDASPSYFYRNRKSELVILEGA